jgi:protein transport protein SEC13
VSGGSDKLVKVWAHSNDGKWAEEEVLRGHGDWVRDVSWAPNIGLPGQTIASCSQDCTVTIWTQADPASAWVMKPLYKFPDVVWRVSWSVTGNILAVASGDNKVSLWKEGIDGEWKQIQTIDDHHE